MAIWTYKQTGKLQPQYFNQLLFRSRKKYLTEVDAKLREDPLQLGVPQFPDQRCAGFLAENSGQ